MQLVFSGTLSAGPAQVSEASFPASTTSEPVTLNPSPTSYSVSTGMMAIALNSPSSYVTLPGIGGAVGPVTTAKFLYLRSTIPMQYRITYAGDAVPKVVYSRGLHIEEVDLAHLVTLVEAQGSGTVTYFAVGDQ